MSETQPQFRIARRGYEPADVDRVVADLTAEKASEEAAAEAADRTAPDHYRHAATAAGHGRSGRNIGRRKRHHRHFRLFAAGFPDDLAYPRGFGLRFLAHHALDRPGLRDLGLLDLAVLNLPGLRFRHMDGAATDNCAARRTGRQLRKGHPYRHKRCSLCYLSAFPGARRRAGEFV